MAEGPASGVSCGGRHIHAWRRSGQRRDEYCHKHGPNPQTFNARVSRLREGFWPTSSRSDNSDSADTATFVPVEVTSESEAATAYDTSAPPIKIDAGGVTLRVAQDADTDILTRVITAARRSA